MSKFVYGTELTLTIENIIRNAQERLLLMAPSVILQSRLKEELRRKKIQDGLQILIVFGKSGDDIYNSISQDDIAFYKEFPNVVIYFKEKLGAHYYANENTAVFTSISLVDYQQHAQVEAGIVLNEKSMFKQLAGTITKPITEGEKDSWEVANEFFDDAISKGQELFRKTPQYDKGFMNLSKKYSRSIVETNKLDEFFAAMAPVATATIIEVEETIAEPVIEEVVPEPTPAAPEEKQQEPEKPFHPGYCIRTGYAIAFDPRNPFTAKALEEWRKEGDPEFPENYCHFSGEPSYGQTSVNRPILQKNLKKAQEYLA